MRRCRMVRARSRAVRAGYVSGGCFLFVEKQGCCVRAVQDVLEVVAGPPLRFQGFVQVIVGCAQLLVGQLEFLVDRQSFFVRRPEFLICILELANSPLELLPCLLDLVLELRYTRGFGRRRRGRSASRRNDCGTTVKSGCWLVLSMSCSTKPPK